MTNTFNVTIGNDVLVVDEGTTLLELAERYQEGYEYDIVLARVDGKLLELANTIKKNCTVSFSTTQSKCGIDTYRRSATLLMLKAFYEVLGKGNIDRIYVMNSVSKGYFCKLTGKVKISAEILKKVEHSMRQMVACNHPIKKYSLEVSEARERFKKHGMDDKVKLFKYRRTSWVNVYNLNGFEDYFYGYMVPSTKYLKYFSLHLYDDGFVIQLPTKENPNVVQEFRPQNKVFGVLKETAAWNEMLEVDTVGALNDVIASGNIEDLILVHEALQEKKIGDIAEQIKNRGNVKYVMIAGPSSSGKTTFSHRLSIQLRAIGLKPHTVAVDNYFVERDKTPRDENGDYNYEILEALDVEKFNEDMLALGRGETVYMPTYNFITGKREYKGNKLKLGKEDVLVIEGIHCLNDKLSYALNKDNKFKIYISALTQLNIDEHNRIPTTDGRLLRRIVRDARTRGTNAKDTISRWQSVRNGEENHIFPFQEEADVMFNSALIYELSVIKQYAEPLLYKIPKNCPEYDEANRLIKFLSYFLGVSSEEIPNNSLVREFVGGGCFKI